MKNKHLKSLIYILTAVIVITTLWLFSDTKRHNTDTAVLKEQFDNYLAEIKTDGTYDELCRLWIDEEGKDHSVDYSLLKDENGTLRFGTTTQKPFSYIEDNQRIGFTVDLVYRFCLEYGYGLQIEDYSSSSALVTAVQMGKADFGGNNLSMTEERRKAIDFSDPYYENKLLFIIKKDNIPLYENAADLTGKTLGVLSGSGIEERMKKVFEPGQTLEFNSIPDLCEALEKEKIDSFCYDESVAALVIREYPDLQGVFYLEEEIPDQFGIIFPKASSQNNSFFASLKNSFDRTFIEGQRYVILLDGITTTLLITLLSVFFGTLIGFLLYLFTDKDNILVRLASWIANGLPVVVLLMIFYYIVFGNTRMSGFTVSLIVFTCTFALSVISILKNAVGAIDPGQFEASYILGYSKTAAFFRIILPQALSIAWSEYKTVIITQIKNTAIVGYIAVQDLTKAGDMIRNITFESFFPLIIVALIYFLFVGLSIVIVDLTGSLISRSERKSRNFLKGVITHD